MGVRSPEDLSYVTAEGFAKGGGYHSFYMWHGGNHYGRTGGAGLVTAYSDDVHLRADGSPNESKYTHISRLQHIVADRAPAISSQDSVRTSTVLGWQTMVNRYSTICLFVRSIDSFSY